MSVDIKRKSSPANINGSHTTYIILKNAMKMEEIEKISHLEIYIYMDVDVVAREESKVCWHTSTTYESRHLYIFFTSWVNQSIRLE